VPSPRTELLLARHADSAWLGVVRPWIESGRGKLERGYIVVPTRGQAQGLKQRCLEDNVAVLGIEFLTPGLARKKWLSLVPTGAADALPERSPPRPAIGRELLLFGLRVLIARRLDALAPSASEWGLLKSLQSDPERALDDFDELLKNGFSADDFSIELLRDVFRELTDWVEQHGYAFAAVEAAAAGLHEIPEGGPKLAGRALVYGLGAEMSGEFANVAAFVRRVNDVTVVLPEPEFRGRSDLDERWVEIWTRLLGVEPLPIDAPEPAKTCESVGAIWLGEPGNTDDVDVLVGRSRGDEMRWVCDRIVSLLAGGAENIAVVFPRADASHFQLARLLGERGVPFSDLLGTVGSPPIDVQVQRALLTFYEREGRIEDLLALWPLLRAVGSATLSVADARRAVERSFDLWQTHATVRHLDTWKEDAPELARVAELLLPVWPAPLTLADALARFRAVCDELDIEAPEGCGALDAFAQKNSDLFPLNAVAAAIASFLPETFPVANAISRNGFARVSLTTRRRAEGLAWSHTIFVESNLGVWPERRDPSCWLTDEDRAALNVRRSGRSLGLFTADDRAALERLGFIGLARNTRDGITFSASLYSEEEPEARLGPNSWLERVLWARQEAAGSDEGNLFDRSAHAYPISDDADPVELDRWTAIWNGRRDPARKFDEYFFAGDPARITPPKLSAKLIERGVQDPAELWFQAVLGVRSVDWEPFVRARRKALGQRAHELLASALQPASGTVRGFGEMPARPEAEATLQRALAELRRRWPADRYWDSFHAELEQICRTLLDNVYAIEAGRFVATEVWLPAGAHLPLASRNFPVVGRIDLVRLDRPEWRGAHVDIVDFKTGGDLELSAERMARNASSLQLGVYLAAAASLGATGGNVWMLKPEPEGVAKLGFEELGRALAPLAWLDHALTSGVYGALTRDRSDYAPEGCVWPLACTPIPAAILERKFAATFSEPVVGETEEPAS
jgi:hypothetical protein